MKKIMLYISAILLVTGCASHSSNSHQTVESQGPELYGSMRMGISHGSGHSDNRVGIRNY